MDNASSGSKDDAVAQPEAEVLTPRASETPGGEAETSTPLATGGKDGKPVHKRLYRPSHRATFIGLTVVAVILLINAGVIGLIIRSQSTSNSQPEGQVTVSQTELDKLGVNRDSVSNSDIVLTVTPNTQFKGKVVVGGDISIGGQFRLNSKLTANDANLSQLEAGNTTLNQLNVGGDSTLTNATLRKDLIVVGTTRLQGPVTLSQLLTINNGANISGNLTVGSAVSATTISATTLTSIGTLTIGGHVVTAGSAPILTAQGGSVLGSNGSISISGNDAAGTIAFNVGVGASSGGGLIASVNFHTPYSHTPHVVVTPVGNVGPFYVSRTTTGFSIFIDGPNNGNNAGQPLAPGGYAFDYIVEQ